jgi:phosphoglycerate dehydrogenase-like enzyme
MKIAILDDYLDIARKVADWSALEPGAEITVFNDRVAGADAVVDRLVPFDVVCVMRERTPLTRDILERLPRLKLIASTSARNASIDAAAAAERGIEIRHTRFNSSSTVELTWALILAGGRHLRQEIQSVRDGGWLHLMGADLRGRTLGILGLGNIGGKVARVARAFEMNVIAWSHNLTADAAEAGGATLVTQDQLFAQSDVLTIHLMLGDRTRGLVGARELSLMKPTARLINTARGSIVDEAALVGALRAGRLAGAGLDVFDQEPLPADHPFRTLETVVATPHIGHVAEGVYRIYYGDSVANIADWLNSRGPNAG